MPDGYDIWLRELKDRIHTAQQRATLAVNRELVLLYWQIGRDILDRQAAQGWGAKVIERLAHDLRSAFPQMKGFSRTNLMYMRAFAEAWQDEAIVQQAVGQLPWGHNLVLLDKLSTQDARIWYAQKAIAVFDRVRHPIAQSYPPLPGCWSFTLSPPLIRGGRGGDHIALHPSEIRYISYWNPYRFPYKLNCLVLKRLSGN
jgi:predicted nuclease of restriction endonuclease-like (RecB) superfamily